MGVATNTEGFSAMHEGSRDQERASGTTFDELRREATAAAIDNSRTLLALV